ncbi:MAG: hypothetical protein COV35_02950 [Alphaproteobacteria bacterium CG11_big_fil_rev_8_21_14_0_20_39_49]|nr:MAG: hypothetical protein COV35_02950 [Alphaproteobacteria bacterium CG11_big_fil_rev_8_21_14_0_20_39_49]
MNINKKHALLAVKILFIIAALGVVFYQTDISKIKQYIKHINPFLLYIAYLFFMLAQIVSVSRMRYYYKSENLQLNYNYSLGLYFTGMLFNTILPGGISGDGYKAYSINKLANFPILKSVRLLLSDRASGLYILLILSLIFALLSNVQDIIRYGDLLITFSLIILTPVYFFCVNKVLKENYKTALGAIPYSLAIQASGVLSVYFIIVALGVDNEGFNLINGYLFLFTVSALLSVLPISIGGVGIRELSFLYGAGILNLNPELGVAIALIFFIINMICSLKGLLFWHRLEKLYNKNTGVINGSTGNTIN